MKFSALSLAVLLSAGSPVEVLGKNNKPDNGNNSGGGKSDIRKRGQAFPDPARLDDAVQAGGVQDKLLVKYKETMSEKKIAKAVQRTAKKTGCSDPVRVFPHAGVHEDEHVAAGLHLHYRFDCSSAAAPGRKLGKGDNDKGNGNGNGNGKGRKAADAIGKLASEPQEDIVDDDKYGISSVDPGYEIVLVGSPAFRGNNKKAEKKEKGDVAAAERELQSGWMNGATNDTEIGKQDHYATIKLSEAWQKMTDEGAWGDLPGVVVQVLDTGKNPNHEDLQINKWTNPAETCDNGVDDDGNGYVDDCHGYNHADGTGTDLQGGGDHGTHCTGTIAADTDNGKGVAGVAGGMGGSPGASIMTSVGFGSSGSGGFAQAIVYGADHGAHISSNSWGYTVPGAYEQAVLDAIDVATDEKGVMVVVAAGNDGSDGDYYPGFYEKAIAVASTKKDKKASCFTNYGSWIDISAPGSDVYSTTGTSETNTYGSKSGTSMACPHVAGILALGKAMSAAKGFPKTRQETLSCLYGTAEDIDGLNDNGKAGQLGAGMADTAAFLDCMASATAIPTPAPTVPPAPAPCAGKMFKLELTTDNYPCETTWDLVADGSGGTVASGYSAGVTEKCLLEAGTYTFTIRDSYGDGICCSYGAGNYKIFMDGVLQHEGGEFGSSENKEVVVASVPSPTPVPPTPQPTTSTTTTTAVPTANPTTSTTTTTTTTTTAAPTANPTTSTTTSTTTLPPTNAPTTSTTTTTTTLPPTNVPTTSTTTTTTTSPPTNVPTTSTTTTTTLPPTNVPTTPPPPPPTATPTTSTTTTTTTTPAPAPTSCNGRMFNFEMTPDDYPSETSWDLKQGVATLMSGGAYDSPSTMCLSPGDYEFTIYDTWGDGICCAYGSGSYTISLDDGYWQHSGGSFGASEVTPFAVSTTDAPPTAAPPPPPTAAPPAVITAPSSSGFYSMEGYFFDVRATGPAPIGIKSIKFYSDLPGDMSFFTKTPSAISDGSTFGCCGDDISAWQTIFSAAPISGGAAITLNFGSPRVILPGQTRPFHIYSTGGIKGHTTEGDATYWQGPYPDYVPDQHLTLSQNFAVPYLWGNSLYGGYNVNGLEIEYEVNPSTGVLDEGEDGAKGGGEKKGAKVASAAADDSGVGVAADPLSVVEPKEVTLKPKGAECVHSSECLSVKCNGYGKCK